MFEPNTIFVSIYILLMLDLVHRKTFNPLDTRRFPSHFSSPFFNSISWWISHLWNLNSHRWILISYIWKSISYAWNLSLFFLKRVSTYEIHFPAYENKFPTYAFNSPKYVNNFYANEIEFPLTEIEFSFYDIIIPTNETDFKNMIYEITWM